MICGWLIECAVLKDLEEPGLANGRLVSNSRIAELRLLLSTALLTGKLIVGVLAICSRDCEKTEALSSSSRGELLASF